MVEEQKQALTSIIPQLLKDIVHKDYTPEARIWNKSSSQMRQLLWNLANLNQLEHNSQFKRDWLQLPNHLKDELRTAIQELHAFVKQSDVCFSRGEK